MTLMFVVCVLVDAAVTGRQCWSLIRDTNNAQALSQNTFAYPFNGFNTKREEESKIYKRNTREKKHTTSAIVS